MAKGLRSRVSARYLPYLADIAALYVAAGERAAGAAEACRSQLEIPVKAETLARWAARSAEFKAAVEQARADAANAQRANPEVRGPRDIAWLQATLDDLRERHKGGDDSDAEQQRTLKGILDIEAEVRAQERHLADLADRAAKRDFARLLRNLVEWAKLNHPRQAEVIVAFLRSALRSINTIADAGTR